MVVICLAVLRSSIGSWVENQACGLRSSCGSVYERCTTGSGLHTPSPSLPFLITPNEAQHHDSGRAGCARKYLSGHAKITAGFLNTSMSDRKPQRRSLDMYGRSDIFDKGTPSRRGICLRSRNGVHVDIGILSPLVKMIRTRAGTFERRI